MQDGLGKKTTKIRRHKERNGKVKLGKEESGKGGRLLKNEE